MQIAFWITRVFRLAGYGLVKSYCIHASVVRMLQEFLYDNMLVRHACIYVGIRTYRFYRFYEEAFYVKYLTLGVHAQRGLLGMSVSVCVYVCVCVCVCL